MVKDSKAPKVRGRGASGNRKGRFESIEVSSIEAPPERVKTEWLEDASKTVLARNDSPDVPFSVSLNPYRGCEHGCVYCYARPTHEYLGFSAGLDFETRILIKRQAPDLLTRELGAKTWKPQTIGMSGVTDPYQPIERDLKLTRACLRVLAEHRNPVVIVTKNALVARDLDLLAELSSFHASAVLFSITTLEASVTRIMEPRTSHPRRRLEAMEKLAAAGVPVGVLIAPVVPAINDHEIPQILEASAAAGATRAGFIPLRVPGAVLPIFEAWLEEQFPSRRDKVLNRLRSVKGGKLNESRFGLRMRGEGPYYQQMKALFETTASRLGLQSRRFGLSVDSFRRPGDDQLKLF